MAKPSKCPRCKGTNIACHLGWCECLDCYYEWSYSCYQLVRQALKKLA